MRMKLNALLKSLRREGALSILQMPSVPRHAYNPPAHRRQFASIDGSSRMRDGTAYAQQERVKLAHAKRTLRRALNFLQARACAK